jgi:hypothetical protein
MGQYFYFYNDTREEKSAVPCCWNFGLLWMKNLHEYNQEEQGQIFKQIIKDNGWSMMDKITATGDYGDLVIWRLKV